LNARTRVTALQCQSYIQQEGFQTLKAPSQRNATVLRSASN